LFAEPVDGDVNVIDPEANVVERGEVDGRLLIDVERLHDVDFHGERPAP